MAVMAAVAQKLAKGLLILLLIDEDSSFESAWLWSKRVIFAVVRFVDVDGVKATTSRAVLNAKTRIADAKFMLLLKIVLSVAKASTRDEGEREGLVETRGYFGRSLYGNKKIISSSFDCANAVI